jgi:translation initiation factor 5A
MKMSKPVSVGSLKVGHHILIENEPCRIVEYEKSKPGKHGSAKARIVAIGVFDGVKRSMVSPVGTKIESPIIEKRGGQVISVSENSVQLMDLETYEVFWAPMPTKVDVREGLLSGSEVEYWKVLDRVRVTRVKGVA